MIPLQAGSMCSADKAGWEYLLDLQLFEAIPCTYSNSTGMLVFGMLVFGSIGLSVYIRTGSAIMPTILVLLSGGAVLGLVAPPVVAAATVLVLASGAGAVTYLYYQYSR